MEVESIGNDKSEIVEELKDGKEKDVLKLS